MGAPLHSIVNLPWRTLDTAPGPKIPVEIGHAIGNNSIRDMNSRGCTRLVPRLSVPANLLEFMLELANIHTH